MRLVTLIIPLLLAAPPGTDLASTVRGAPVESLAVALRRLESAPGQGAEAALMLGRLHYARGEYHPAADAYARAAARLDPVRKPEARYWAGLCWLALGDAPQARSALEDVAHSASAHRPLAVLALAQSWELAGKPDRAFDLLEELLKGDPGEAGATALVRFAALATQFERHEDARRARIRLQRDYPASIEAASARLDASAIQPPDPAAR